MVAMGASQHIKDVSVVVIDFEAKSAAVMAVVVVMMARARVVVMAKVGMVRATASV